LFDPQTRPGWHSLSLSQSPSLSLHRLEVLQQLHAFESPLQVPVDLMQQSAAACAPGWKDLQLLVPHFSPGWQSVSRSQSPPPTAHRLEEVQQLQAVEPPLHTVGLVPQLVASFPRAASLNLISVRTRALFAVAELPVAVPVTGWMTLGFE